MGQTLCFCKVEATLKFSNTTRNPRRPFLGCLNDKSEGLPYCNFFKWVDSNEENELELREKANELERKEKELEMKDKELEKRLEYLEKREAELGKKSDDIEKRELLVANLNKEVRKKELMLVLREAKISRS
ncbi:hypothetical protein I3843_11G034900 [Carya illinoinensis]|nr:hypothetical protein I3843_11G034900 [Carya illinoinensis]